MKFLYLTDTHLTARGPKSREDNYVEALFSKLEEIKQVIKAEDIKAVFHGGDLFDKPTVSIQLIGRVAQYIKSTGVPWYVVPGNHDLFGYNISTLPQTSLGLLEKAGVITLMTSDSQPVRFVDANQNSISFYGQEYHKDIDKRDLHMDYQVVQNSHVNILIPHSMLMPKPYFPEVPHTIVDDLKDITQVDLILVGHYHDGFTKTVTHTNGETTHVVNPGSVMRDEASKCNMTRVPKYVIVDYENGSMRYSIRDIQIATPGAEIFTRIDKTEKEEKDRYLESFAQKLSDQVVSSVDIQSVLDELIHESKPDKQVAEFAKAQLIKSEQQLSEKGTKLSGFTEKASPYYINSITIKGFQSHEDTTIELSDGLNAITGPSDSGKSAVVRALRFALYNEPKGSDFIRVNSPSVSVEVAFSDGTKLTRKRTKTSAGSYIITKPDGTEEEFKGFNNNIPIEISEAHQMPMIPFTKDAETSLNIGYQLDPPFLIGESPGTRAAIIGKLTGADLVDDTLKEMNKAILSNNKEEKYNKNQLDSVQTRLELYNGLDEEIDKLTNIEQVIAQVEKNKILLDSLYEINNDLSNQSVNKAAIEKELSIYTVLVRLAPEHKQLKNNINKLSTLSTLHDSLSDASNEVEELNQTTVSFNIDELQKELKQVKDSFNSLQTYTSLNQQLTGVQSAIEKTPKFTNIPDHIVDLNKKVNEYLTLSSVVDSMEQIDFSITDCESEIKEYALEIDSLTEQIEELRNKLETCPTCGQVIQN